MSDDSVDQIPPPPDAHSSPYRSTERIIGVLLIATHAAAAVAVLPMIAFGVTMQFGVCSYRPECSNTRLSVTLGLIAAVTIAIIVAEVAAAVRTGRRRRRTIWIGPVGFVANLISLVVILALLTPA